ncbi:MAG: Ig-like domain-containing protein, partial [Planctomycetaceae bacterium]
MKRTRQGLLVTAATFLSTLALVPLFAADVPAGLGDPGTLTAIKVEPNLNGAGVTLRGRDARQQLYVTGEYSSGQQRDFTRTVQYSIAPEGIATISANGMVAPLMDGNAIVKATTPEGAVGELAVHVEGVAVPYQINFGNQIVPIFTKLGCNSGGCHGKASGQNGFKLSLLGFYPNDDHEFLVKEGRGRRLFPSSPSESLLLTKATGRSPHGGGKRMEVDSHEYRLIYRWVEQGTPFGSEKDPVVTGIQCYPPGRIMARGSEQQFCVIATYSDGTT